MNKHLPSLDGWRAISVLLVLLDHCKYTAGFPPGLARLFSDQFSVGALGVRFFFVISGFLITWLLLQEHAQSGRINLKNFYIRRALRIFPVCFLFLGVLALLPAFHQTTSAWLSNFFYFTNYGDSSRATSHLWSLGVEEQFYLLWPAVLLICLAAEKRVLELLACSLVIAPIVRLLYCKGWYPAPLQLLFQPYSFFAKFDSLGYGCVAACLFYYHRQHLERCFLPRPILIKWAAALLILLPGALWYAHVPARLQALFFEPMQAIGFAILLLQSVLHPDQGFFRALNWRPIRHLGVLSYSVYIWQGMFCSSEYAFGVANAWWGRFPAWILVTLLAAHLSYYLMEKPLFQLRARFRA
jgi:peptidoglycan/LPS O-acetylase OafA/YrhL